MWDFKKSKDGKNPPLKLVDLAYILRAPSLNSAEGSRLPHAITATFLTPFFQFFGGDFFCFFTYYIQHFFICRPSDSTVPTDAGIEPRTVATGALAVRLYLILACGRPPYLGYSILENVGNLLTGNKRCPLETLSYMATREKQLDFCKSTARNSSLINRIKNIFDRHFPIQWKSI